MNITFLKAYYLMKPIIPRRLQIFVRRKVANFLRHRKLDIWPINPTSAVPPSGFRSWPYGKKFAFILSHDVDTRKGYENVLKLSSLEEQQGFVSTFNFVPERYGEISLHLIEELKNSGFGVGVHGLKHDGKIFTSRRIFNRRSKEINNYLKKWKCLGFSSPSMHHRLDWMNALNIGYSTSTFDTDPFEPQPDGVGTIFPLLISNGSPNNCFVELPITMPQDSTLFIILKEPSISVWKQKLDWIAQHGGMVLLNTHPDYMCFDGTNCGWEEYPSDHFSDFLTYVKERYVGQYWNALAEDVACYWKTNMLMN
jgi:hypothetical protein